VELDFMVKMDDDDDDLRRKDDFYYQVQTQMLCLGLEFADFVVWSATKDLHIETIQREEEFCADIVRKSEGFFYNSILPQLFAKHYSRSQDEKKKEENASVT